MERVQDNKQCSLVFEQLFKHEATLFIVLHTFHNPLWLFAKLGKVKLKTK